ncbi:NAD-dependent epimerase/dehydratase family protein [Frondihabitans australicus]|uniref:Nucleoside-diphosphate-sugar epimerase n=1 Tax=Frondihabitans australicus TaxID=386892 RepID=A0A495IH18_9MICO|nr:NAD-dependent epimerase/dehydratase family protein [Frondihabitans australicus]RKR75277.1 nucleoside-diphosphate-sugar epimerase [Frondihabitans australicus]
MGGTATRGRALVTGASGFLGGHVVSDLREHGYEVVAAGRRREALPADGPTFVGDLDALAEAARGGSLGHLDVVVHCAALSSPWGQWRDFEHANVIGTSRALTAAHAGGARRFVHISSPGIYAAPRDLVDLRESDVDPSRPMNSYIRSKLEAEALLRDEVGATGGPEIVVLRPRGIIGPGDPALVPRLLRVHQRFGVPLMRGGRGLIDLTAVENVALAVRLAAETPGLDGEVFNITNGDPRPFVDLLDQLLDGFGLPHRHRPLPARLVYGLAGVLEAVCGVLPGRPEPSLTRYTVTTIAHSQTLDISRARRMLGYEPRVTLDESLASYVGAAAAGSRTPREGRAVDG